MQTRLDGIALAPSLQGQESEVLQALLRCSDYGVLMSTLDRQDVVCNRKFGEIFGLDLDETVSSAPLSITSRVLPRFDDPEAFLRKLAEAYSDPALTFSDELVLQRPCQVVRRHTCPVEDRHGRITGRLWTFLDITDTARLRRQVEQHARALEAALEERTLELEASHRQLVEVEKLSAVGTLAASVAHDIRNILTPLTLEMEDAIAGDAEAAQAFRRQVDRLSALTHRLLAFAKPAKLERREVDLHAAWLSVLPLVEAQANLEGVRVRHRCEGDPPWVQADPAQIEQVFVNLALNAIQAMRPQGGELSVEFQSEDAWRVVWFRDTGPGIPAEHLPCLFDPFFTTRESGTGLGLHSCRRILRNHDGIIHVRNGSKAGAEIVVRLPASRQQHHAKAP